MGINEREAAQDKRFGARGSSGLVAQAAGFNLHAGVVIAADDRDGLERLCRYAARPAVALSRLTMLEGGQVAYRVKHEWVKGKAHLVMEPMELMIRLSALIPPPRFPLVRYHGVLAPNSPWRAMVVPGPRVVAHKHEGCGAGEHEGASTPTTIPAAKVPPTSTRLDWATLLHRVWGIDALRCDRCGGRLRFIAVIEQREVIDRILEHHRAAEGCAAHRARESATARRLWGVTRGGEATRRRRRAGRGLPAEPQGELAGAPQGVGFVQDSVNLP